LEKKEESVKASEKLQKVYEQESRQWEEECQKLSKKFD